MLEEREFQRTVKDALAKIRDKDMRILQESNIEARESEAINAEAEGAYMCVLEELTASHAGQGRVDSLPFGNTGWHHSNNGCRVFLTKRGRPIERHLRKQVSFLYSHSNANISVRLWKR